MTVVTKTQLENASLDAASLAQFVNGPSSGPTSLVTTRTGELYKSASRIALEATIAGGALADLSNTLVMLDAIDALPRSQLGVNLDRGSVLDFIPEALHENIRNRTNAVPLDVYIAKAFIAKVGFFPKGDYLCNAQITDLNAEGLVIYGELNLSRLVFNNVSSGLKFKYSDQKKPVAAFDIDIVTNQVAEGIGLEIASDYIVTFGLGGPIVRNVRFYTSLTDLNDGCWEIPLKLSRTWYGIVDACTFKGWTDGTHDYATIRAIELDRCQAVTCSNNVIQHAITGIEQTGNETPFPFGEGVHIFGGEIVGVRTGIKLTHSGPVAGNSIHDIHINASVCNVDLFNQVQTSLHNLILYETTPSTDSYIGIKCDFADNVTITNVKFSGASGPALSVGVQISNSKNVSVDKVLVDYFVNTVYGVLVGGGNDNTSVTNVTGGQYVGALFESVKILGGTNGKFKDNYPLPTQNLLQNSATPSVDNSCRKEWTIANTVTTSITNVLGMYDGQEVEFLATDSLTTLVNNANIILQGGANYVMTAGDIVCIVKRNGVIRERYRTNN